MESSAILASAVASKLFSIATRLNASSRWRTRFADKIYANEQVSLIMGPVRCIWVCVGHLVTERFSRRMIFISALK